MFRRTTVHLNLNEKYEGFEESEAMVMDKIFPKANEIDQACAFDIILGHSQGAILIAALLSLHEKLWKSSGPSGYILNGCAWPNPYSNYLVSMTERQRSGTIDSLPRIIFIMGKEDNINPIDSAMQVHDAYRAAEFDVSMVNHGGGHSVPVGKDKDSERALEEVVDWIVEIAKQKALHLTNYV
jgi:predicted esterase